MLHATAEHLHLGLGLLALALVGCTGDDSKDEPAPADAAPADATLVDATTPDADVEDPCEDGDLAACAYEPLIQATLDRRVVQPVPYTDAAGQLRTIEIEIRLPQDAPTPAPVVVWSHGGASGKTNADMVGLEWSRVFVEAGYVAVTIAHAPRSRAEFEGLCASQGWQAACGDQDCMDDEECTLNGEPGICVEGGCRFLKHLSWDRPHDFAAVVDFLEMEAAPGGRLEGRADPAQLAYAGHSGGAGGTLMVAGATRQFAGTDTLLGDPRPLAFISASPQGPGDDGFTEDSFTGEGCAALTADITECLSRPHLFLTGIGDETQVDPLNRRLSFDLAPLGGRHLAWITEASARHTTFEYKLEACERVLTSGGEDTARCETYRTWLRSVTLAFLDAYVRGDDDAMTYLQSDHPALLSEGAMEWSHR